MTEGARRQCRLALTRKNTETNDELQLALFSSNDWSEESRQVRAIVIRLLSWMRFHPLMKTMQFAAAAPGFGQGVSFHWVGRA